ncbi:MAG: hypothetical protein F2534_09680, partial [Actinobacteria bacterium]|nr:hypothetical protein [Actinomycetota bacterium]
MTATTRTPHTDAGRRTGLRVRSRRIALIGAVVVLGLTACGTDDDDASGSPASSLPAPAVIEIAGAGGSGGNRAGAPASMDAAMESSKIMPALLTYEWAGGSIDLTGPAASWFFAPGTEPTVEQVQALAAALGVTGEVTELAADMGGGWTVGPTDGSAPSVTVGTDAMQSWWYSPAWNTAPVAVECVEPIADASAGGDASGAAEATTLPAPAVDPCVPQPPANVPSADEARALATELFESLGIDVSQYELDVYADEWGANVSGSLVLDGVRTNLTVNVGFGENGAVTWAGGFLATPQRGADYPRIGVEAAVQRLNDQSAAWMTGYGSAVTDMARADTAVAGATVEPAPAPVEET